MDAIDISSAARRTIKLLEKSGQIGKTEYREGWYSYNGDPTGKLVLNGVDIELSSDPNVNYVRISEDYIRGDLIDAINLYRSVNDLTILNKNDFSVTCEDGVYFVQYRYSLPGDTNPFLVLVFPEESGIGGVYAYEKTADENGNGYIRVSLVGGNTTETNHPINPKFIPALDFLTLNGADGKQHKLTVDENGALAVTAIE